jgi:hypothetical protein
MKGSLSDFGFGSVCQDFSGPLNHPLRVLLEEIKLLKEAGDARVM